MELVARGEWVAAMRGELKSMRNPETIRDLPFCVVFILYSNVEHYYEEAQREDLELLKSLAEA